MLIWCLETHSNSCKAFRKEHQCEDGNDACNLGHAMIWFCKENLHQKYNQNLKAFKGLLMCNFPLACPSPLISWRTAHHVLPSTCHPSPIHQLEDCSFAIFPLSPIPHSSIRGYSSASHSLLLATPLHSSVGGLLMCYLPLATPPHSSIP